MRINDLVAQVHEIVKSKGFWDTPRETGTLIALIHSEVSEALEADTCAEFCTELADICMRIMDLCGGLGIDLKEHSSFRDIDLISIAQLETAFREQLPPDFNDFKHACGVHMALSKALEADRKDKRDDFIEAIGTALLLTLRWAAQKGYSIEQNIYDKMEEVKNRVFTKRY